MKLRLIFLILLITSLISGVQAAKVNGTVYEWSDFEKPLKNVVVELEKNSTRVQLDISQTGYYEFDHLSPGNYMIKAKYYRNNILEYAGEENVSIENADDFKNIDMLLFPPTDSEVEYLGDINLTGETGIKREDYLNENALIIVLLVFLLAFSAIAFYFIMKKRNTPGEPDEKTAPLPEDPVSEQELPQDLRNLYDLILGMGGRTTQKDLRKKMSCSEAKVSLMITDLEDRGLIKKIKKGRSNIIIAENKK
ncbi:MAG TPA: hypothetical protein VIO58_03060 [Candidatus Methanoperedens sp.]